MRHIWGRDIDGCLIEAALNNELSRKAKCTHISENPPLSSLLLLLLLLLLAFEASATMKYHVVRTWDRFCPTRSRDMKCRDRF